MGKLHYYCCDHVCNQVLSRKNADHLCSKPVANLVADQAAVMEFGHNKSTTGVAPWTLVISHLPKGFMVTASSTVKCSDIFLTLLTMLRLPVSFILTV